MWIDVHTHINMLEDLSEEVVAKAAAAGVERMITIGTELDDLRKVVELVDKHKPYVFGTLGYHPHEADHFCDEARQFMRENLNHPRIVGVGEIGLDYYYEHSDRKSQVAVFEEQMGMAQQYSLPVEIHTRDAEEDTIAVLKKFEGKVKGLLHCFTGTQWLADEALKLGYNISVSGVATFKNAQPLREVIRSVPLDRIHLETDAPFLTPVPFRGKKNAPEMMVHTAKVVAELKGVSLESLADQTRKNALKMFSKLNW